MSYAGFWKRVAAWFIDVFVAIVLIVMASLIPVACLSEVEDQEALGAIVNMLGIVVGWIYFAAMESSPTQGTLGKMALGIKVTDIEGNRISFGKASGRHFGKILSNLLLLIGFVMVAFTKKKQGLHDMMAGCLVVNK